MRFLSPYSSETGPAHKIVAAATERHRDGVRRYIWKESKELTAAATEVHRGNGEDSQIHHA